MLSDTNGYKLFAHFIFIKFLYNKKSRYKYMLWSVNFFLSVIIIKLLE